MARNIRPKVRADEFREIAGTQERPALRGRSVKAGSSHSDMSTSLAPNLPHSLLGQAGTATLDCDQFNTKVATDGFVNSASYAIEYEPRAFDHITNVSLTDIR